MLFTLLLKREPISGNNINIANRKCHPKGWHFLCYKLKPLVIVAVEKFVFILVISIQIALENSRVWFVQPAGFTEKWSVGIIRIELI
jgi:hypothetical protein